MPQLDLSNFPPQLFWLALVFGVLYLVLSQFALPKVERVVEGREQGIADDLRAADAAQKQASHLRAGYEEGLAASRADATKLINQARADAARSNETAVKATDAKIVERLVAAEQQIGASKDKALAELQAVATEAAEAIVTRLTGQSVQAGEAVTALLGARTGGRA